MLLGSEQIDLLNHIRDIAVKNPVDISILKDTIHDPAVKKRHSIQMTRQSTYILAEYLVTYSVEVGHPDGGTYRHMSVSVPPEIGRLPLPSAIWMIAENFGFSGGLDSCYGWVEHLVQGIAVNVVQKV